MIGVDIVEIARLARILREKHAQSFIEEVLTYQEAQLLRNLGPEKVDSIISELFAAKESVIKASRQSLTLADFHRINVAYMGEGKCIASIEGGDERFMVSTSILGDQVIAMAVSID